ncbi:hypothetical protein Psi02_25160 [Planotetraspora silvatica]|uniref:HNH nuclease domain-containing protein n=1 Tax=Planotetraspora silvatica TaxID=234614 RepID=A0A8J3ULS4_9ACTN|nr:HNH endonuclease signature motif containing protein [Planotetraspora silvatica]GII46092.1 hypothetical protein Psi02_25160 [Planotetraspora silvatica]
MSGEGQATTVVPPEDVSWWADEELLGEWPDRTTGPEDPLDAAPAWLIAVAEAADRAAGTAPRSQLCVEPFAEVAGVAPGGRAAAAVERAVPRLPALPDAHVLDVLAAARRLASWAEAVQVMAAAELHGRPVRDEIGRALDAGRDLVELNQACVVEEIAAKLRVTSGSAAHLVSLGRALSSRFPEMGALLAAGVVDVPKVLALVQGTALLDEERARAVQAEVVGVAGELTSARLRARVNRLALQADPELAERKRREAENRAHVRVWRNQEDGTATLALMGSPVAWALAASDRVDALARAAKEAGDARPLARLRLITAYALLLGRDPDGGPGGRGSDGERPPDDEEVPWPSEPMPDAPSAAGLPDAGVRAEGPTRLDEVVGRAGEVPVRRTHWLAVPYASMKGDADLPGELQGFGLVTVAQARDLARDARRWVAVRDVDGQIILHGEIAVRAGPDHDAPGSALEKAVEEADRIPPPEPGYRPSARLDLKVRARDGTCRAPSCNHSAWTADVDHTRAYDQGGPTAYGNLAVLHRRHHRIKGTVPGVRVRQIRPGRLLWTARTGDTYLT